MHPEKNNVYINMKKDNLNNSGNNKKINKL